MTTSQLPSPRIGVMVCVAPGDIHASPLRWLVRDPVPVAHTFDDYVNGRDPLLDKALQLAVAGRD